MVASIFIRFFVELLKDSNVVNCYYFNAIFKCSFPLAKSVFIAVNANRVLASTTIIMRPPLN